MDRVVGIGEYAISNDAKVKIKTFALGSCVALTVYSPVRAAAGMVHIALPNSDRGSDDDLKPCFYADRAVPFLINRICSAFGCSKGELRIELFGGADSIRKDDVFNIGQRNIKIVKEILSRLNLSYSAAQTGGAFSRTIGLDVGTGKIEMSHQPITI